MKSQALPLGPLIVDVDGCELNQQDRVILLHPLVGGVILFARNFADKSQVTELVAQIKALRTPELIVCVDQEGGRVQRFKQGFTELPPLNSLGKLYQHSVDQAKQAANQLARIMASEVKSTGVDFSFAPVVDVFDADSEIIADRAFHERPSVIAELAGSYIEGLHQAGCIAVAKHFPGHGGVLEDSHLCLPVDRRCFQDVLENDLIPYRALFAQDLDAIMTAHVLFEQVDALPSGFSDFWIKNILRDQLGFSGVIFTDDLSMQGAVDLGTVVDRTRMALTAGADVALICNDRPAVEAVLSATELACFSETCVDLDQRLRRWSDNEVVIAQDEINSVLALLDTAA